MRVNNGQCEAGKGNGRDKGDAMMEGWKPADLGSICDILDRLRKPITKRDRIPGPYPYHGATGVLDHVEGYLFDEPLILVGEDGAKWGAGENTAFAVNGKCWVNNHAHVLRPNRSILLDSWLLYYLNHCDLTPFITGLTVPKLNQGKLREIPIPLPPLSEQLRIVGILDEAFAAIATATANAKKNLANARGVFESQLNAVLDHRTSAWAERQLGDVCENLDSRRVPITKSKREPGDVTYYGASGVVDYVADYLFDEDVLLISEDGANLLARTYPIAFSINGKAWVNNHAHVLRFKEMAHQKFVEYYLNSITLEPYVSGMAQPKLNQKALNSIPLPWSDVVSDVLAVVDSLEATERESRLLLDYYQQKLALLAELTQSILHKAFTGELTADHNAAGHALSEGGV